MEEEKNKRTYTEGQGDHKNDVEENKTMAGLAYLLFFLPLIACPDSEYGKFHANQALVLWIVAIVGSAVLGFIPFIGWILSKLFSFAVLLLGIYGMVNGFGGKVEELPVIGSIRIIK